MSMTQIAFLKKAELPTNRQIQESIQYLGYDFKILGDLDKQIDENGLECSINGQQTFFETYLENADDYTTDTDLMEREICDKDTTVLFIWGADYAAGACIGLISIALIDRSQALIYYMDDQMKYTRDMLIADIPQFLEKLKRQDSMNKVEGKDYKSNQTTDKTKRNFRERLKALFR